MPTAYKCSQCGITFDNKSNYNRHQARKTPCAPILDKEDLPDDKQDNANRCRFCGRVFARRTTLLKHMKKVCKIAPRDGDTTGMDKLYEHTLRKQENRHKAEMATLEARQAALEAAMKASGIAVAAARNAAIAEAGAAARDTSQVGSAAAQGPGTEDSSSDDEEDAADAENASDDESDTEDAADGATHDTSMVGAAAAHVTSAASEAAARDASAASEAAARDAYLATAAAARDAAAAAIARLTPEARIAAHVASIARADKLAREIALTDPPKFTGPTAEPYIPLVGEEAEKARLASERGMASVLGFRKTVPPAPATAVGGTNNGVAVAVAGDGAAVAVDASTGKTTVNISVFGKEQLDRITKPMVFDILRSLGSIGPSGENAKIICEKAILKTAMLIFSDPKHPENITCFIPNKKGDNAMVHGESGWELQPVGLTVSPMAFQAVEILFKHQPWPWPNTPPHDYKWIMEECGRIMTYMQKHEGELVNEPPRGEMRAILIRNKDLLSQVLKKLPMAGTK